MGYRAVKNLRTALSLLTTIPVGSHPGEERAVGRAVVWFPVVGALLGAVLGATYAGLSTMVPPVVASGMTVALGIALTGALHEDGLADTLDAFGGSDQEEALRILRDPDHGTYGVVGIVTSIALRAGALATLDGSTAVAVLTAAHAVSRGAAAVLLRALRPARPGGLGASYAAVATRAGVIGAATSGVLVALVALGAWAVPMAVACGVGTAALGLLARHRMGGLTGDVVGAAQQVGEAAVLVLGAAAGGSSLPGWWR